MKYIDADKLTERVTKLITSARQNDWPIAEDYLRRVIDIIKSLQREQPIGEEYTIEVGKHTHTLRVGSQSDIDKLIRQEKQEQPEVDLEKEYKEWWENKVSGNVNIQHTMEWYMHETAKHFYGLGLNARKEE